MKVPKRILERRRATRIVEVLPFTIGHQGYDLKATSCNLSSHGAMCVIEKDIPLMTQLKIGFSLPSAGAKSHDVQVRGVIVRKEKDPSTGKYLIAIFFSDVKPRTQQALDAFIEHRLSKK
jgi:c-di-GMP-binding flagellar brake protein YcgR